MAWTERLYPFHYLVLKMKTREAPSPVQATQRCVEELTSLPIRPKPVAGKGMNYSRALSSTGLPCVIIEKVAGGGSPSAFLSPTGDFFTLGLHSLFFFF